MHCTFSLRKRGPRRSRSHAPRPMSATLRGQPIRKPTAGRGASHPHSHAERGNEAGLFQARLDCLEFLFWNLFDILILEFVIFILDSRLVGINGKMEIHGY